MIRVRGLTKRFGEVEAITDISFDVAPGEILTLLGPNGSGKTTTLKCIVGLDIPSAGDIAVDGIDLVQRGREARERLSYLPQRVRLPDSLTARETLRFYSRLRKLPATSADSLIESSDVQLKGFADRPVGEFSGGMVQRGVAVALLPDAPVLVLDEPTASLDP